MMISAANATVTTGGARPPADASYQAEQCPIVSARGSGEIVDKIVKPPPPGPFHQNEGRGVFQAIRQHLSPALILGEGFGAGDKQRVSSEFTTPQRVDWSPNV